MAIIIAIVVSSIISCIVTMFIRDRKAPFVGTLRIDRSDPSEPPYPFLEINKGVGGVDGIARHKFVLLEVKNENYVPQE